MSEDAIEGRIFVGGLDHDCDEVALDKAFSMFGEITQILIMRDRDTNQSRGFGFISFDSQEAADDAIRRMHGVEVMGRCVTVRKAEKQAAVPERGGFRGRRGGFRGGRGRGDFDRNNYDSRYQKGSYQGGRRHSSDFSDGYRDSRGGGRGNFRRGGYTNSRSGYSRNDEDDERSGGYGGRRGGYDNGRHAEYGDMNLSDEFDDVHEGPPSDRYMNSRRSYVSDKYDSHKSNSRSYGNGASREGFSNARFESGSRGRSRSPITRLVYREESPVPSKMYGREYSPVHRPVARDYSPPVSGRKSGMSKGYGHDSREVYREYSPPARGRVTSVRDISPEYAPSRTRGRAGSPQMRGRARDPSPVDFGMSRNRARAGSPRGRSNSGLGKSMGPRKPDFAPSRSQDYSSRGGRYESSSNRDFHRGGRGGGRSGGPGSRPSYGGHSDTSRSMRYKQDSPSPPPPASRGPRESIMRNTRRPSRRSPSPLERRERRY